MTEPSDNSSVDPSAASHAGEAASAGAGATAGPASQQSAKGFLLKPSHLVLSVSMIFALFLMFTLDTAPTGDAPIVTWKVGKSQTSVEPFASVPMYEPMRVTVALPKDAYVYVVSFDHQQGAVVYFPTDYLGTDYKSPDSGRMNFFRAGTYDLPGVWNDQDLNWFVPNIAHDTVSLCVVVSETRLADLESRLNFCMQMGNTAFPDKSMGRYMPRSGKDSLIGTRKMPHAVLEAAMNQAGSVAAGPMVPWTEDKRVFLKVLNVLPGKPLPGQTMPGNPYEKQIRDMVKNNGISQAEPPK